MHFGEKILYLLAGTGLGAGIGLLFAPRPGQHIRDSISHLTHKAARHPEPAVPVPNPTRLQNVAEKRNVTNIAARARANESIEGRS